MKENEARLGRVGAEKRQADFARLQQIYAKHQETLCKRQALFESAVQYYPRMMHSGLVFEDQELRGFHDSQLTLQETNLDALIADISSRLDRIVAYLTPKEKETWSETREEKAKAEDDLPPREKGVEKGIDSSPEKVEAERGDDSPVEEEDAETEDDIRLKALFARTDRVIAQNKGLGKCVEFKAQDDAFLNKHDEWKTQRLDDGRICEGLEEIQETS